jgi:pyruvate formate lyase activating enzyme
VAGCPKKAIGINGEVIEGVSGISIDREKCVRCFACVKACNFRAIRTGGMEYSVSDIVDSIMPDIAFFTNSGGGVTITGGEPLMQAQFTREVLADCRKLGIHTMIETSGQGSGVELKKIAEECSGIYYDIKLMDPVRHQEWTGVTNKIIMDNLNLLCRSERLAKKIIIRTPCIPEVNDAPEDIKAIAEFVKSLGISVMQLMPYNSMAGEKYRWIGKDYSLSDIKTRDNEYYEKLNGIVESAAIKAIRK